MLNIVDFVDLGLHENCEPIIIVAILINPWLIDGIDRPMDDDLNQIDGYSSL